MKNLIWIVIGIILMSGFDLTGQELNLKVIVNAPNINKADPATFVQLEQAMTEFMNTSEWTEDSFEPEERIEGTIQINITEEISVTDFKADLLIQTARPVYNSTYSSPILTIIDKNIVFKYQDNQPIEQSDNAYFDNLSSVLSFYAYLIIGYDYDTFSQNGGDPYFKRAQNVVQSIPSARSGDNSGWEVQGDERNRFNKVDNMFNPRMQSFRSAYYEYHRKGLDMMYENPDRSRAVMASAITAMGQVNQSYPNAVTLQMFADAKRQEIIDVFTVAPKGEKGKVADILMKIDPTRADQYRILK